MSNESNRTKNRLLGMPHGTASNRLRKMILYSMLYGKVYSRNCFQCGQKIEDVDDLSIEHKEPWQSADDPKAAFFDLENIAFSHLRCNSGAAKSVNGQKDCCPKGHPYDDENTRVVSGRRHCKMCHRSYNREWMQQSRGHSTIGSATVLQAVG